jgi:hypothetical protein
MSIPTSVNAPLDEFWRPIKLDLYGTFLGCRFGIPELIRSPLAETNAVFRALRYSAEKIAQAEATARA